MTADYFTDAGASLGNNEANNGRNSQETRPLQLTIIQSRTVLLTQQDEQLPGLQAESTRTATRRLQKNVRHITRQCDTYVCSLCLSWASPCPMHKTAAIGELRRIFIFSTTKSELNRWLRSNTTFTLQNPRELNWLCEW